MKTILKLMVLIIFSIKSCILAQSPNFLWARQATGAFNDVANSVSTDLKGNVFVTGYFKSPILILDTTYIFNVDYMGYTTDVFISKYNQLGTLLWANQTGGDGHDDGHGISSDINGNVIVVGGFNGSYISFGNISLTNIYSGWTDVFIAKYDSTGNILWAKRAGGTSYDVANCVTTDTKGNIIVAGVFQSSNITFGFTTLTNSGNWDIFIVKFSPSGNVIWAKKAGGSSGDMVYGVSADVNGNIIITGYFQSPTITFGTTTLTNSGVYDVFVAKYDSLGNVIWANKAGGSSWDQASGVATDGNGNVFIAGSYSNTPISFGSTTLTNSGEDDIFISKYNASGNLLWAKKVGGPYWERVLGVTTNTEGSLFVTGYFYSPYLSFGNNTLINSGNGDIFVAKYDSSGNALWAKKIGGIYDDWGSGICTDVNGDILIAGLFKSPSLIFDMDTLTNFSSNGNTSDIFVAKLNGVVTDVPNTKNNLSFNVYPNPSYGKFYLIIDKIEKGIIEFFNILGDKIYETNIDSKTSKYEIDLSNQPKGIYFVKIISEQEIIIKKIIIQ
jgi:hypothetical protein